MDHNRLNPRDFGKGTRLSPDVVDDASLRRKDSVSTRRIPWRESDGASRQ
jgi:hypothetical protein